MRAIYSVPETAREREKTLVKGDSDAPAVSKPASSWREENGVLYFSVTSDGTLGADWISRLEGNGYLVVNCAKQVLLAPSFTPTSGVTTNVAVLRGELFESGERNTAKIRAEAEKRNLSKPNAEVACLIREKFTGEEIAAMGLWWIVAMHEPIQNLDQEPSLLYVSRGGNGRWLNSYGGHIHYRWYRDQGFAFMVSKLSSQI